MSWRSALGFQVAASAPFLARCPFIKHDFTMTDDTARDDGIRRRSPNAVTAVTADTRGA